MDVLVNTVTHLLIHQRTYKYCNEYINILLNAATYLQISQRIYKYVNLYIHHITQTF